MTDQPVKFLLVDDLSQNLYALENLLRREGLELLKARSGGQALELLLKHDIALALIDVQMPGMDGFELAELMRGTERTRRIPIIFLTAGNTDQKRRFQGYEAGAVDFLQKPIETNILKSKADIFFNLYQQRQEVARQRDTLQLMIEENKRLLDESRRYTAALKEADRKKDEFLATLAHELRNPLGPIRQVARLWSMPDLPEEQLKWSHQVVERQSAHMSLLLNDLLDLSRITRARLPLRRERTELASVIDAAVETATPLIETRQHQLEIEQQPGLILQADPVRLAQVLANLLGNAAKYTEPRGRIMLQARASADKVVIRVSDTGVGIKEELLPQIFDMFSQDASNTGGPQDGLGIGLALVKGLVELHGGRVEASSGGPGEGSTFTISLPMEKGLDEHAAAPLMTSGRAAASATSRTGEPSATDRSEEMDTNTSVAEADSERPRRILVADDNRDAAQSLAMLLELEGHEICIGYDGQEALDVGERFRPDIILLDIGMPGMDGYSAAREIRRRPWGRDALLLALTGWGQARDRERSRQAGFDNHLVKPLKYEELNRLIAASEPA